jgi:hypothetical protein
MAYPFVQHPTWKQLIEQFEGQGVSFNKTDSQLESPEGDCESICYFEKSGVGKYAVSFEDENERVAPTVVRSICAALDVEPAVFGLTLG